MYAAVSLTRRPPRTAVSGKAIGTGSAGSRSEGVVELAQQLSEAAIQRIGPFLKRDPSNVKSGRYIASGLHRLGRIQCMQRGHKRTLVKESWRWRYRNPKTGRMCRTMFRLTEQEASELPEAERIEGSMLSVEVEDDDFPETGPEIHSIDPE